MGILSTVSGMRTRFYRDKRLERKLESWERTDFLAKMTVRRSCIHLIMWLLDIILACHWGMTESYNWSGDDSGRSLINCYGRISTCWYKGIPWHHFRLLTVRASFDIDPVLAFKMLYRTEDLRGLRSTFKVHHDLIDVFAFRPIGIDAEMANLGKTLG